jgi:hypothetical protein
MVGGTSRKTDSPLIITSFSSTTMVITFTSEAKTVLKRPTTKKRERKKEMNLFIISSYK